jgi:hypothetical protein
MGEEASTSGRQKALREATIPLNPAITRSRAAASSMAELSSRSGGAGKRPKQKLGRLADPYGAANGDAHKEVSAMWSKLFGGGGGLPREKVDAVVHVIDRYLAEEAELRSLQSEKQTIHPSDLTPARRRALIEEVFAILASTSKK